MGLESIDVYSVLLEETRKQDRGGLVEEPKLPSNRSRNLKEDW